MSNSKANECTAGPKLVFACSGAADVGEITDRAARKMSQDGGVKMFCLAGIGGRVEGIMKNTEAASKVVAIDGCSLNCAKGCLEHAGFSTFAHLQLADLGLEKGKSPATEERISQVVKRAAELVN